MGGKRTGISIVDMNDTSQMPVLAEPWFVTPNADVEMHPVMMPEDLGKADLVSIGKKLK